MARTDTPWTEGYDDTYIQTIKDTGYNILINGLNKYLNFNQVSGSTGYGFRDNNGAIEYKDFSGSWSPLSSLSSDEKVKLNASDPTAGYLDDKISAGNYNVSIFNNDAGYLISQVFTYTGAPYYNLYSTGAGTGGTGDHNILIGDYAGNDTMTGNYNFFAGSNAGKENTSGYENYFLGSFAGYNNKTGYQNYFFGSRAGVNNISGYGNNFFGAESGYSNTSGHSNNFLGFQSGYLNTTGFSNNFFGDSAGFTNDTGNGNNYFGYYAGYSSIDGVSNNFFGYEAGRNMASGYSNNFFGYQAGINALSSYSNNFFGYQAGYSNDTGGSNNFFGYQAGYFNTTGVSNNFFGFQTGLQMVAGVCNNFIGYSAGRDVPDGNYNNYFGFFAGIHSSYGSNNNYFGYQAGENCIGSENIFIGINTGGYGGEGNQNIAIGSYAGYLSTSSNNIFLGAYAGQNGAPGNSFYVNNIAQVTAEDDKNYSLLYGGFSGVPTYVGGQFLAVNGMLKVSDYSNPSSTDFFLPRINLDVIANPNDGFIDFSLVGSSIIQQDTNDRNRIFLLNKYSEIMGGGFSSSCALNWGEFWYDPYDPYAVPTYQSAWEFGNDYHLNSSHTFYLHDGVRSCRRLYFYDEGFLMERYDSTISTVVTHFKDHTTPNGDNVIGIGSNAGAVTNGSGVFIGKNAGKSYTGGMFMTCIGDEAGGTSIFSQRGVYIGQNSGANSTSSDSVYIGKDCGLNTTANYNVFIGYSSGAAATTASYSLFMGYASGTNSLGSYNVFLGQLAGANTVYGSNDVYVGPSAGLGNNGSYNVCIGRAAGLNLTDRSIFIGDNCGAGMSNGQSEILMFDNVNRTNDPLSKANAILWGKMSYATGASAQTLQANAELTINGDTFWINEGTGLPYGSCWGNEINWTQAATQNTWYNISDADMSDGQLNLVTHDGSGKLTVAKAGRYKIEYTSSVSCSANNAHVETGIEVSGSGSAVNDGRCSWYPQTANAEGVMCGTAILDLAANATIEISILTATAGTPTLGVNHLNITLIQVGGT